jgi:hypothetical protein
LAWRRRVDLAEAWAEREGVEAVRRVGKANGSRECAGRWRAHHLASASDVKMVGTAHARLCPPYALSWKDAAPGSDPRRTTVPSFSLPSNGQIRNLAKRWVELQQDPDYYEVTVFRTKMVYSAAQELPTRFLVLYQLNVALATKHMSTTDDCEPRTRKAGTFVHNPSYSVGRIAIRHFRCTTGIAV